MAAAIGFRDDFDAARLRALAKASRDPDQLRRLLSMAEIFDGGSRGARKSGTPGFPPRFWILAFSGMMGRESRSHRNRLKS